MEKLLTLKDAATALNVKPYRIGYVLAVKLGHLESLVQEVAAGQTGDQAAAS